MLEHKGNIDDIKVYSDDEAEEVTFNGRKYPMKKLTKEFTECLNELKGKNKPSKERF